MTNSLDPDQTARQLFAAEDTFRYIFFLGALRVNVWGNNSLSSGPVLRHLNESSITTTEINL